LDSMPTLGKHDDSAGYIAFIPRSRRSIRPHGNDDAIKVKKHKSVCQRVHGRRTEVGWLPDTPAHDFGRGKGAQILCTRIARKLETGMRALSNRKHTAPVSTCTAGRRSRPRGRSIPIGRLFWVWQRKWSAQHTVLSTPPIKETRMRNFISDFAHC
jgi:hypothetical protein